MVAVAWIIVFNLSSTTGEPLTRDHAEYRIKAAFIYNFTKFVEWPHQGDTGQTPVLRIGILGSDPFGPEMDSLSTKILKGRTVIVARYGVWDDSVKQCDILFISGSESQRLPEIMDRLGSLPVLTIGDTVDFAARGVMLNFFKVADKIRFEVNLVSARRANLIVSSHLIRLAKVIAK